MLEMLYKCYTNIYINIYTNIYKRLVALPVAEQLELDDLLGPF